MQQYAVCESASKFSLQKLLKAWSSTAMTAHDLNNCVYPFLVTHLVSLLSLRIQFSLAHSNVGSFEVSG